MTTSARRLRRVALTLLLLTAAAAGCTSTNDPGAPGTTTTTQGTVPPQVVGDPDQVPDTTDPAAPAADTTTSVQPTTTVVVPAAGSVTVRPTGGDDTDALTAAVLANRSVVIDQPLRINKVFLVPASDRTITFTGRGALVRSTTINPARPTSPRTFQVIVLRKVSNVTLVNPQVAGPGGICDVPRPPGTTIKGQGPTYDQIYNAKLEAQHAIEIDGATNIRITGGYVHDMAGDGVYITHAATDITITDLHTRCTGRSSISNVGSLRVTVTRGTFERSGLWIFNVEPDAATLLVSHYTITGATVGPSNWEWLWVGGNCRIDSILVTGTNLAARGGVTSTRGCGPGLTLRP